MVKKRLAVTSPEICGCILREAKKFNHILIFELIDSSDGVQVFSETHLEDIYQELPKIPNKTPN